MTKKQVRAIILKAFAARATDIPSVNKKVDEYLKQMTHLKASERKILWSTPEAVQDDFSGFLDS